MEVPLDLVIRNWLARYLAGEISLRAFQEWFVPESWNVQQTGNEEAVELVYEIELRLAEFSRGHWTEQNLHNLFLPLLEQYTVSMSSEARTSSVSDVSYPQVSFRQSPVDMRLSTAS